MYMPVILVDRIREDAATSVSLSLMRHPPPRGITHYFPSSHEFSRRSNREAPLARRENYVPSDEECELEIDVLAESSPSNHPLLSMRRSNRTTRGINARFA
jgi:hypothetical protein